MGRAILNRPIRRVGIANPDQPENGRLSGDGRSRASFAMTRWGYKENLSHPRLQRGCLYPKHL